MKIKRWFSKKIQDQYYGGNRFEGADFGCEMVTEISEVDSNRSNLREASKDLHEQCKKDVERSINSYIKQIKEDKEKKETEGLDEQFKRIGKNPSHINT